MPDRQSFVGAWAERASPALSENRRRWSGFLMNVGHAVIVQHVLDDVFLLRRVTGGVALKVRHDASDHRFVYALPVARHEPGAPGLLMDALATELAQLVQACDPGLFADEVFGGLHGVGIAGPPPVLVQQYAPRFVLAYDLAAHLFRHVRVEEAVRKADEVGREPVSADV